MSRRSRRWDTWVARQYRRRERADYVRHMGRHSRWWDEGQAQLRWDTYAEANGISDEQAEAMLEEMPF